MGEGWDKIIEEHREHPLNPKMPKILSSENGTLVTILVSLLKFRHLHQIGFNGYWTNKNHRLQERASDHRPISNNDRIKVEIDFFNRTPVFDPVKKTFFRLG